MDLTSSRDEESCEASYSEVDSSPMPTEPDARLMPNILNRRGDGQNETEIPAGPAILDELYPMNHKKRGIALIFNHDTYKGSITGERKGALVDGNALKAAFRGLGFDIDYCPNYTFKQISDKLEEVRAMDHSEADCLAVVVMTHGRSSELYAYDKIYQDKILWESFTGSKCPSLRGKPKLFFVQACRGQNVDDGVKLNKPRTQTDGKPEEKIVTYTIPNTADLLIAHATFDGYYAWRSAENGSWFIQALCNELRQHGTEYDILRLMTAVNRRVAITYQSHSDKTGMDKKKQMSTVLSTLTRLLYFTPKKD